MISPKENSETHGTPKVNATLDELNKLNVGQKMSNCSFFKK